MRRTLVSSFLKPFAVSLMLVSGVFAQNVDVVVKEGNTYGPFNIGITGIEARFVPNGSSHDLVVVNTIAGSLADGQFLADDLILTVNGTPITGERPRVILGDLIRAAEASDGIMDFAIDRGGSGMNVILTLPVLGAYSATWPLSCPKSDAIVTAAADYYAGLGITGENSVDESFQALFLLSTGDDDYLDELATYVATIGVPGEAAASNWTLGYNGIVLGEYYLRTGDVSVLPSLQGICDKLLEQSVGGAWGHSGANPPIGYANGGIMNTAGVPALLALVLGQECGVTLDQVTFEECLEYFWRFAGRGGISYGVYQPDVGILNGNSKNATLASLLWILGAVDSTFEDAAETVALQVLHAYPAWESRHGGNGLRLGWEAMAVSLLKDLLDHFVQGLTQCAAGGLEALEFFGPEVEFDVVDDSGASHDGGNGNTEIADAVGAVLLGADGEEGFGVEGDGVDGFGDGRSYRPAGSAFTTNHFCARPLRAGEELVLQGRGDLLEACQGKSANRSRGPDGNHAVAVFAEDQGFDLGCVEFELLGDQGTETRGVEHGAQSVDLLPGQVQGACRKLGKNVHGVGNHEHVCGGLVAALMHVLEDAFEDFDVAVDKVQTRLIGLPTGSGGDDKEIRIGRFFVAAGGDALSAQAGRTV